MADPFIGQIMIVGFNFAPRNWAFCEGQLLPIAQNSALFSLLGTTYGGDGRTTFGLPDMRGRVCLSPGSGPGLSTRSWGQKSGAETHTLNISEMPSHNHGLRATSDEGDSVSPGGKYPASAEEPVRPWGSGPTDTDMGSGGTTSTGANFPHNNMQPYLAMYFCIALQGIFPSRN